MRYWCPCTKVVWKTRAEGNIDATHFFFPKDALKTSPLMGVCILCALICKSEPHNSAFSPFTLLSAVRTNLCVAASSYPYQTAGSVPDQDGAGEAAGQVGRMERFATLCTKVVQAQLWQNGCQWDKHARDLSSCIHQQMFHSKGSLASPSIRTPRSLTKSRMDIVGQPASPLTTAGMVSTVFCGDSAFFLWLEAVKLEPNVWLVSWMDYASRGVKQHGGGPASIVTHIPTKQMLYTWLQESVPYTVWDVPTSGKAGCSWFTRHS